MFFILSGFVLALPYWNGTAGAYRAFVIRRFFRIYIPYIASIFLAVILASFLANGSIPGIDAWQSGISIRLLFEHVLFLYNPDTQAFNNVVWSLVHEMRISLIFPFIVLSIQRISIRKCLLICLLISLPNASRGFFTFHEAFASVAETLHYTSMFIIGALIARNRDRLVSSYLNWSKVRKWSSLLIAFVIYSFSTVINSIFLELGLPNEFVISDYAATMASSVMIIFALGSAKISKLLLTTPLIFLGTISYSLYLYHILVLFSLMYLFYGSMPNTLIYLSTIMISVLLAALSWRFVERPSIALGRRYST